MSAFTRLVMLLTAALMVPAAWAQVSFTQREIPTAVGPAEVEVADLNKDGKQDFATVSPSAAAVAVHLSNGDGTFRTHNQYTTGGASRSLSIGDVDRDGDLDLVTANQDNTVSVLKNHGDGSFGAPAKHAVGADPNDVVVGDFDKNGYVDLVTSNAGGRSVTFLWGGSSGYSRADLNTPSHAGGRYVPDNLVSGDFNSDGNPDLAYTACCNPDYDFNAGMLYTLLGNGTRTFTTVLGYESIPDAIFGMTPGRINADNRTDLAFTYSGCHDPCQGAAVMMSDGDGTFTRNGIFGFNVLFDSVPQGPAIADVNRDGLVDLVVVTRAGEYEELEDIPSKVHVALRRSDGQYDVTEYSIGRDRDPSDIAVGRFNGDTAVDFVTANSDTGTATVLLQNAAASSGSCAPPSSTGVVVCTPKDFNFYANPVRISAAAKSGSAIKRLEIWIDGSKRTEVFSNTIDYSISVSGGQHRLVVVAVDTANNVLKKTVFFSVCSPPPTPGVTICQPISNATVASPVRVVAAAKTIAAFRRINVWVDGVKRFESTTSSTIDTAISMASGRRRVTVQAVDANNTIYKTTVYINVQ